jgi:hypothetical protein
MPSKLAAISADPILRTYSQGASQAATSPIADFLAPTVPVSSSVGRYKVYTAANRYKIPDTRRAMGGRATEIGFTSSDATFNCAAHALDCPQDVLEQIEGGDLMNVMQEAADLCAEAGALSHEKTVVDLAIATVGGGTALSIGSGDDIIDQLDGDILTILKACKMGGMMDLGVLIGAGAWRRIKNHASVKGRIVSGAKRDLSNITLDDFSALLMTKAEARVSLMCYDTAPEGKAESISFVLDGDVLIFARRANPTRFDPSFMKTFRLRNQFMVPGSYLRDDGRVEVAKYDWSEDVQVTNSAAAVRRTVALS